jgi:hypothetical protein
MEVLKLFAIHLLSNIYTGAYCARASPSEDFATGFFVACFERKDSHFKPKTNSTNSQFKGTDKTSKWPSKCSSTTTTSYNTKKKRKLDSVPSQPHQSNNSTTTKSKNSKKKRKVIPVPIVTTK